MGEVWLAEDTRLERRVALKLLPAEFTQDSERLRRFTQEAKAASALSHPNIISVYDIGECETGRFIVMEFVSGRTLRSVITSDNSIETFFALGRQMAGALGAAHAVGITHRDIKPDNIMVRDDGYVKVLDFGLARLLPTTSSDPEAMTLAQPTTPGTVMGTLAYMSPEQARGQTVGSASDVFALGIVLYELVTGRHPFKSETMIGYLHAITSQVPPSMTSLKSHIPAALNDLILGMLEKDAKHRPTASEVAQALQEIEKYGTSNTLPIRIVADKEKATRKEEGFWIAVLPFKYAGSNADVTALAEGLSEDIVTGLSRFSYLRVIARGSTLGYSSRTTDLRTVGKELGARYVMEGSLRQAGSVLRVTVQLVDTTTGAQLWAETYERTFRVEEIFALQDELVPKIVSTAADRHGVLPHSMSEALRNRDVEDLRPYEVVLRGFGYFERVTAAEHAALRAALERAVEQAPTSDSWAMLAIMYCDEYRFGFNPLPDSLGRALAAAQRAVEAAVSNSFAIEAQAQSLFFLREFNSFRNAAARAVALNPLDGATTAFMGLLMAYAGDWEHGCSLAERAMQLNPHHPGWYWSAAFWNAYRNRDYRAALSIALKFNMPGFFYHHVNLTIVYGQLGERESASKALRDLLVLKPDFALSARYELGKWLDPELVEHAIDGLRRAGLETTARVSQTADDKISVDAASALPSFESRPAIAVLPFDNLSTDPEQEYFADGLAEDLITRLSLWRSFPVIARNSSFGFKGKAVDIKKVSADLAVRYLVQGSVRKSGNQARISAQLIDATTGHHLWAKSYDRELTDVFQVQDEISEAIAVSVVGDLERAERARVQRRAPESLEAWGLYQRALPLIYNFTCEDCAEARSLLERSVALDSHFSSAMARLAEVGVWEVLYEWTDDPETTLNNAVATARRAVALDSQDAQAHVDLSFALMTAGDGRGALEESRQAVELNPSMPFALAVHAYHQHIAGYSPEESIAFVQRAIRLSPHDPVEWLFYDVLSGAYLNAGRFVEGLEAGRRLIALSPNYYWGYLWSAMNAVGLDQVEEARNLVLEAHRVKPEVSFELARKCLGTMAPDVERRFCEALHQSGL